MSADGRGADARVFAAMCRALAVKCIESDAERALIDASDCDAESAHALRDAFTVMLLADLPRGFRVAIVINAGPGHGFVAGLQRDLARLQINARLFDGTDAAADWLDCARQVQSRRAGLPAVTSTP